MLDEKRALLKELSEIEIKDFEEIIKTKEYDNLCQYYMELGFSKDMAIEDIFEYIDGVYVIGDIRSIYSTINGTEICLDISKEDPCVYILINNNSYLYKYLMLEQIRPEETISVTVNLPEGPYNAYMRNGHYLFNATAITKYDERITPIKICPKCKSLYRPNDMIITTIYKDMKNQTQCEYDTITYCPDCCTESEQTKLIECWDSNTLYSIYNDEE